MAAVVWLHGVGDTGRSAGRLLLKSGYHRQIEAKWKYALMQLSRNNASILYPPPPPPTNNFLFLLADPNKMIF